MARVCLTEKQKREAAERDAAKKEQSAIENMYLAVRKNLSCKMNLDKLTQAQAAEKIGICCPSISRLLSGKDLQINIKTLFRVFYWLGLEVVERDP